MDIIVVDTNILANSPKLRGREWQSLFEHRAEWGVRLAVPEVVVMETIRVVRRNWAVRRAEVDRMKVGEFGLTQHQQEMLAAIDEHSTAYAEWLPKHLKESGVEVVSPPPADLMEISERAAATRAPYCKDKDGFRDTLIWLTVVDIAVSNPHATVWFVSENHTDFGPKPNDWTGPGQGSRDDCPILFHKDLIEELRAAGLEGRVQYVVSLDRLEQHLAAQFAPIADDALSDITASISTDAFRRSLVEAARGYQLAVDRAALAGPTLVASIADVVTTELFPKFTEGARRGGEVWTARFTVTAVLTLDTFPMRLGANAVKELRLSGDLTAMLDGTIRELIITSVEALDDDPERAASTKPRVLSQILDAVLAAAAAKVALDRLEADSPEGHVSPSSYSATWAALSAALDDPGKDVSIGPIHSG